MDQSNGACVALCSRKSPKARPEENQTEPPGRLTATSADSCRGGWVVRVLVAAAESVVEGVDGLALEAESDVAWTLAVTPM